MRGDHCGQSADTQQSTQLLQDMGECVSMRDVLSALKYNTLM